MKTHFKGDWFIDKGDFPAETLIRSRFESENYDIASFQCDDTGKIEQNAKLIVQSPEMLRLLKAVKSAFIHVDGDVKGNKTRTEIFKNCPEFAQIATDIRRTIEKIEV